MSMFGVGWSNRLCHAGIHLNLPAIVLLTDCSAPHFVDTILCSDRVDDGPANGSELSSLRDREPFNDGTGCRVFVAGTKILYRQYSPKPLSCF